MRSRLSCTIKRRPASWLEGRKVTTQNVAGNRRGLASLTEPIEPMETADEEQPLIDLDNDDMVFVKEKRKSVKFLDRHWLRDSCDCNICVDPDSGQKNFGTCEVPTKLPIAEASITADGGLDIVWENDFLSQGNHVSHYSALQLLGSSDRRKKTAIQVPKWTLWDKDIYEQDRLTIDYDEWMAGEGGFISGLHQLNSHGLVFLRNVPSSEQSVVSIANQIGNIQETFYGRTWDVRSKPNAENVAYTNSFLGLHQDLLYLDNTPRIQLLHCLENTCEGGDSLFSDAARASSLARIAPDRIHEYLCSRDLRYSYKKHGHYYENSHSILNKDSPTVFWSPPFQSNEQIMPTTKPYYPFYRQWLDAANKFRHLLEDEQWMYQYKMQPGECVIFDNLRVLHGRKQFDTATGSRHLKGTYIANDTFWSKLQTLAPQLIAIGKGDKGSLVRQATILNEKHKVWDSAKYRAMHSEPRPPKTRLRYLLA
ncbi:Clavaminate synthase-like protein [Annulohypoxylon moriforme]|nr:Clavaminate synthase-like protein [Annulohypoxylon moriforme]